MNRQVCRLNFSFLLLSTIVLCIPSLQLPAAAATDHQPPPMSLLHTSGTDLVNSSGHVVTLTGVNLGGWLVEEPWMEPIVTSPPAGSPFKQIKDHVSLWGTVKQRFGAAGCSRVRAAFRSAWITEDDFARLHALGVNCVRLPFLSSLVDEPDGLSWLDRAIAWAGKNHIYVILDMHGAPGSQSDQDHTGQADLNMFFKDPANISKAEQIWTLLARRYRASTTVAGYDMLNEPTGTPNSDTLYVVEDHLYSAIRAGDPDHVIFIEDGYTAVQWMPFPGPCGWANVAYSTHYYNFNAKNAADQQSSIDSYIASVDKERTRRNIPFYVGEYGLEPNGTPAELTGMMQTLVAKHISSTMWTYKVAMTNGGQSFWGLFSNTKPVKPLNAFTDSEAELIDECTQLRTENLVMNSSEGTAIQHALLGSN